MSIDGRIAGGSTIDEAGLSRSCGMAQALDREQCSGFVRAGQSLG